MEKYAWNFQEDAEHWYGDTHATIEGCIEDAKMCAADGDNHGDTVYIGEAVPFAFSVDALGVIEGIRDEACDFAGDHAFDWEACDTKKSHELDELSETLTAAVLAWMEKYGYTPYFYVLENIKAYRMGLEV